MDRTAEAIGRARAELQAGRIVEAEKIYREVLRDDPRHAEALHLLGLIAFQIRDFESSASYINKAIQSDGTQAAFHTNLAGVYAAQGRWDEARACFANALRIKPDLCEAHNGLGTILLAQGKAVEAIPCFQRAIAAVPDDVEAHRNLGSAYEALGQWEAALAWQRRAIEIAPSDAQAHFNLAVTLYRLRRLDEAVAAYEEVVRLRPGDVYALNNLGCAYHALGKTDEALACYRRALNANPGDAKTLNNLGDVLRELGQTGEAQECFRRALVAEPDYPEAHYNQGVLHLCQGRYQEGWAGYAWRLKCAEHQMPTFGRPRWQGESLVGRTLLVHAEQGFGDTLQMLRYVPLVQKRGGTVFLGVQPELESLVRSSGYQNVIYGGGELPHFDLEVPMMSLPGNLATTVAAIPAEVPYLIPDSAIVGKWRTRLADLKGFKVGIHWHGSPTYAADHFRTMPLSHFAPLAGVPGVTLISLQQGHGRDQLSEVREAWSVTDVADELTDFHETAAVMKNLDLVITCDSAVAHLAGALDVPVWIALSKIADWRWEYDREDSTWYPSARLFRQRALGDWSDVFARMAAELATLAQAKGQAT